MKPELFDVIELLIDIPGSALQSGDRGTIVEEYGDSAYEVEFTNFDGETTALQAFTSSPVYRCLEKLHKKLNPLQSSENVGWEL